MTLDDARMNKALLEEIAMKKRLLCSPDRGDSQATVTSPSQRNF